MRVTGLDLAYLLVLLVIGWLWIWGPCWNPWRTSCLLQPDGHGDPVQHFLGWRAVWRLFPLDWPSVRESLATTALYTKKRLNCSI
jgi:hypothetical protein